MKIRVLLHKPKRWDLLGQGIRFWTWLVSPWKNGSVGPYDHAEVWTADLAGDFESVDYGGHLEWIACGTCWTSTMRGDNNGTVKRPASEVIHNPKRWYYIEIDLDLDDDSDIYPDNYDALMNYMEDEVRDNKGYGIFDFAKFFGLGWLIIDKLRNICSEFVNNALWQADIIEKFGVVSPRRLAYLLVQAGYKIKSLRKAA